MKKKILPLLACPTCYSKLGLQIDKQEDDEIIEGTLKCKCGQEFPITKGIPRILLNKNNIKKAECFEFEWKRYKGMSFEEEKRCLMKRFVEGEDFFKDKIVLDVGCGMGRYVNVVSKLGAKEVVGIDIIRSVDVAYSFTKELKNVNFIQADILNLPFKKEAFDIVYCLHVLHHTPNPYESFNSLPPLVKKDGTLAVWVYGYWGPVKETINKSLRAITTRIPLNMLWYMSYLSLPFNSIPVIKEIDHLVNIGSSPKDWRMRQLAFFDRYSARIEHKHTPDEVVGWFKNSKMKDITITSRLNKFKDPEVKVLLPNSGYPKGTRWLLGNYATVGVRATKS